MLSFIDDKVDWSQDRYEEIVEAMKPFLVSAGFASSKTTYLPLAAMEGINVVSAEEPLLEWYKGSTLLDALGKHSSFHADIQTRWKSRRDRMRVH
jgi:elongation factor 1 alpha-like protein